MCVPDHYYVDCIRPAAPAFTRTPDTAMKFRIVRFAARMVERARHLIAKPPDRVPSPKPQISAFR